MAVASGAWNPGNSIFARLASGGSSGLPSDQIPRSLQQLSASDLTPVNMEEDLQNLIDGLEPANPKIGILRELLNKLRDL